MSLTTNQTGAIGELSVTNYFIQQGYEVFRNVVASGPGDLCVWKAGEEPKIIDVKSLSNPYCNAEGNYCLGKSAPLLRDDGVYQVTYITTTGQIMIPNEFTGTRPEDQE